MRKSLAGMFFIFLTVTIPTLVYAGCGVTITGRYETAAAWANNNQADLLIDWRQSDVRIKVGTWAELSKRCGGIGFTRVAHGESFRISCTLDFSCSKDRRYRVKVCKAISGGSATVCSASESAWAYAPSPSGWTSKANIDLVDLGKKLQ